MQCNTLTCFHTARASVPRGWARQPWQGPARGRVAPRGHCELATLLPNAENTTQPKPDQGGEHTQDSTVWALPRVLIPDKSLFSFPFPTLGELILTLVTLSPLLFYRFTSSRATWQQNMKLRLQNCPVKSYNFSQDINHALVPALLMPFLTIPNYQLSQIQ